VGEQFAELMQKKYGQLEIKFSGDDDENDEVDDELEFAPQLQEEEYAIARPNDSVCLSSRAK
jgi:hypothetical protein